MFTPNTAVHLQPDSHTATKLTFVIIFSIAIYHVLCVWEVMFTETFLTRVILHFHDSAVWQASFAASGPKNI